MDIGFALCIITGILFIAMAGIAAFCKERIFSYEISMDSKTNAAKSAAHILEKYGILKEDEILNAENGENEDEGGERTIVEEETEEKPLGRIYEKTENVKDRVYDSNEEIENINDEIKDSVKTVKYPCINIIKGKQRYEISKRKLDVNLSEDIYNSNSIAAVCVAGYEATKLSEGIDRPLSHKIIACINFIPRIICQFSWILIILCLFGMLYMMSGAVFYVGVISFIAYILSCLDIISCLDISRKTLDNLIGLQIINESERPMATKMLNLIAFIDMTRFSRSFRWFANVILGYHF